MTAALTRAHTHSMTNGHAHAGAGRRVLGAVSAAFPDAAEAGAHALRMGGNAIDAACATAWALSVCEPAESGLGGQTTMLVHLGASGRTLVIDGHSRAPKLATRRRVGPRGQRRGPRACVVPSTVLTLGEAQRRYGRLTLAQVLEPAVRIADQGYIVTRLQQRQQSWTAAALARAPHAAELFLHPSGRPYRAGEVLRQPVLAETLRRLCRDGYRDFYDGELAREIAADMELQGGVLRLNDLSSLRLPVEREPLWIEHAGHRVCSVPPPGGGPQILLALRVLSMLGADMQDDASWRRAVLDATFAALRERERWADHPRDVDVSLARWMVSEERAEPIAAGIRRGDARGPVSDSTGEEGNTTHLCAADAEGNVVSLTQSIQSVFGAKVVCGPLGFVYNNYLSTCPRTPHAYMLGPRCLPQSNAAPTLALAPHAGGWRPRLVLGSAGSRRIVSSVVSVLSAVLDRGRSLGDAVSMPRVHPLLSGKLWAERGAITGANEGRVTAGFSSVRTLGRWSYKLGAVHALGFGDDGVEGAADPRRDGAVVVCSQPA